MEIVIDEWIASYLEDKELRSDAFNILNKIYNKCDKLVTVHGEQLDRKIWRLSKKSNDWTSEGRSIYNFFIKNFRLNSSKFILYDESQLDSLPKQIEQTVDIDDQYLVKAAIKTKGLILTTDIKLKNCLSNQKGFSVSILNDFISEYDC